MKRLKWVTPHFIWYGTDFNVSRLRSFGCKAYINIPKERRAGKFGDTARHGILVGYRLGIHNWRILTSGNRVEFSHDVIFDEAIYPGISPDSLAGNELSSIFEELDDTSPSPSPRPPALPVIPDPPLPVEPPVENQIPLAAELDLAPAVSPTNPPKPGYDYVPATQPAPKDISSNIDPCNIITTKRRAHLTNSLLTTQPFYEAIFAMASTVSISPSTPKTYKQALASPDSANWLAAVKVELQAMERLEVWEEVPISSIPFGVRLLHSLWVFRKKFDADGNLVKYKARLVAQGSAQQEGVDYNETYAPTGRSSALRVALTIGVNEGMDIHQMDVCNAFLNGNLDEAPRVWYWELSSFFKSINFTPSPSDPCLFVSQVPDWKCMVHVYVDDMAIISHDVDRFKKLVNSRFLMDDLGPANSLLGMKITRHEGHLTLSQERHIDKILSQYNLTTCRSVPTPMVPNTRLVEASPAEVDEFLSLGVSYRRAIGSINYIAVSTRPDIAFTVSQLSQHLENPGIVHWRAFLHVLRYLSGTIKYLVRIGGGDRKFRVYTDANWGNCGESRWSYSGYLVTWGDSIIAWKAKKQASVSTSTTEAEYRALYDGVQEAVWLNSLMVSIDGTSISPVQIYCDNQAAIALSQNPLANQRTKHIYIKYHFIREAVENGWVEINYVSTVDMAADGFTKSLARPKHLDFLNFLKMVTLNRNNSVFILDSGATTSMFNSVSSFPSYQGIHDHVYLANGDKAKAIGQGTASIELPHAILQLKNSLLVPSLTSNLISLSAFIKNNYTLKSGGGNEFILADELDVPVITGSLADGNFIIHQVLHSAHKVDIKSQPIYKKHQAAGHPSLAYFFKMFPNIPKMDFTCNTCDVSKAHKEPFLGNFPTPTRPLEYLHVDLCGPISTPSVSGHQYFLRAVNGFSHFIWIRFLALKSDVNKTLRDLFTKIENESNTSIVNLVSNNGTEFKNKDLSALYISKEMNHLTTAPYTPEENPFAERGNQTGNVKITHHVKFNDHVFPSYPSDETDPNASPLTFLFDDENHHSETSPSESSPKPAVPEPSVSDSSDEDERFEELLVDPQQPVQPDSSLADQPSLPETPAPGKNYTWVPADRPAPNNISSDIDAANIISGSRRSGHSANAVGYMKEDPQSYIEAIRSIHREDWSKAIDSKLGNMDKHEVWTAVTQTKDMHPLSTTWVFRRKTDQDGNLTKFKARLCVRGFLQKEGRDYTDVFSPTGRLTSLRILLTLCALNNFEVHQMDVKCAFLNGKPEEVLYIKVPQGLNGEQGTVLKLNKSLYGLKQSPQCWHHALTAALKEIGLTPCHSDPCLYFSADQSKPMFLYAHVDDLIFGGTWTPEFKSKISSHFDMEDLGLAKYALGIRIIQEKGSIKLIQDKYIHSILTEFQIYNDKDTAIPLPNNYNSLKFTPSETPDKPPFNYRRVDPKLSHYQAACHALQYLCHTKSKVLILGQNDLGRQPHELVGYSDSDWNGSKAWNSHAGSVIYYNGTIGWRSHKQDVVALSSAEGEYIALTECNQDLLWAANVLEEITQVKPTLTLYTDNQSSMQIAKNPIYHHGTRHMNFRYHFIRDHIESKTINLQYMPSTKLQTDLLTKNLTGARTAEHATRLLGSSAGFIKEMKIEGNRFSKRFDQSKTTQEEEKNRNEMEDQQAC
ncbi:hypothetical protein MJO29_007544 [Puccinia striiformis f. sp. tritici]|nr:hypothetical protein MJO29_007544 [Puccinia striiformis f. sp. tritici]